MRPYAIAFAALLSMCRGARSSPPDATTRQTPPAVDDTPRAPATPCESLMAEGARALGAWKRHSGVADEARWRAIGAFNHCEVAEGGVWATVLDAPSGDAPRTQPSGRFKLVWIADDGTRSEAHPALVDSGESFALRPTETNWTDDGATATRMGSWTLFDYDGDHTSEVIVQVSQRASESGESSYALVWKAAAGRVQPFEPAMGLHPVGTDDVDHDGRPDLVTHADLVASYTNAAGVSSSLRGPRLAAMSRPGGVFLTSSGAALRHNRAQCPVAPTSYFGAADAGATPAADVAKSVACAALWRVPAAQIIAVLHRECPSTTVDVPRACLGQLPALEAIARAAPQADVRDAVSFRAVPVPVIDAGADAPRASYTLHVEGSGGLFPPTVNLGELPGVCSIEQGTAQVPVRLRCWWAGAGDEFQVLRRGAAIVVQRRSVDEQAPPSPWRDVGRAAVPTTTALRAGDID